MKEFTDGRLRSSALSVRQVLALHVHQYVQIQRSMDKAARELRSQPSFTHTHTHTQPSPPRTDLLQNSCLAHFGRNDGTR